MAVNGPTTGFTVTDPNTGNPQDLGNRYVSKDYLLDVYPNLVPGSTVPGLWTWGWDAYGQLGNGTRTNYTSPIQIGSLTNWKSAIGGDKETIAIKTDGTLWAWGLDNYGQLGNGVATSGYSSPIQIGSLTNWKQVSCGGRGTVAPASAGFVGAINTDGTLWMWGKGDQGQLGDGTTGSSSSPKQIGLLNNWKQVECGHLYTMAIKLDGTMWAWGINGTGELANNNIISYSSPIQIGSLTNWKQVSCGYQSAAAVKIDGTLWTWGQNLYGQLGNNTINYYSSPIQVGSLTNWKQVSIANGFTAAIKTDGTLWSWGYGGNGQLGNNTTISYSSPIQVGSLTNWKMIGHIAAVSSSIVAIKTDGTLWAWGLNNYGLGNGSTKSSSPVQIGSLTTWKQVSAGAGFTAAIADGYI